VKRGHILKEALNDELIPTLRRVSTPPNVDTCKQCRYHHNFKHATKECQTLKDKIKEFIQVDLCKKGIMIDMTTEMNITKTRMNDEG